MVRLYRLMLCEGSQYVFVSYYLDPSCAAGEALRASKTLPKDSYYLVQQVDVYPNTFQLFELLRVDGLADLNASRCHTR